MAVQVAVLLVTLVGFAALTIDVGRTYRARAELQRAADAAALAGVSAYTTDAMMLIRMGTDDAATLPSVLQTATDRINLVSGINATLGMPTIVQRSDVTSGWIDVNSAADVVHPEALPTAYNALRVAVRRDSTTGGNGPVDLYFMSMFGKSTVETGASAVAVFDDRFSGFTVSSIGARLLPFSVHEDTFSATMVAGSDHYAWDPDVEQVFTGHDRIRELELLDPNNFEVLSIGTAGMGPQALIDQVANGITPTEMEAEIGTSHLDFFDEFGNPVGRHFNSTPGQLADLALTLESLEGQVVGFFVHNTVAPGPPGAGSVYGITQIRFGRVMDLRQSGEAHHRGFWVQPVSYDGAGVEIAPAAPSSSGLVGRVVLVR